MSFTIPSEVLLAMFGGIVSWCAWVTRKVLRSVDSDCARRIETKCDVNDAKLDLLLNHFNIETPESLKKNRKKN